MDTLSSSSLLAITLSFFMISASVKALRSFAVVVFAEVIVGALTFPEMEEDPTITGADSGEEGSEGEGEGIELGLMVGMMELLFSVGVRGRSEVSSFT
jgi:hypothetical protein